MCIYIGKYQVIYIDDIVAMERNDKTNGGPDDDDGERASSPVTNSSSHADSRAAAAFPSGIRSARRYCKSIHQLLIHLYVYIGIYIYV